MKFDRREFLAGCTASAAIPSLATAQSNAIFRPEDFGARGDGVTNDTSAFAALSDRINRIGGGRIVLAGGKTYIVGEQFPRGGWAFTPSPVIALEKLSRPLSIVGNGARLRCQSGLRYGSYSRSTGEPIHPRMPHFDLDHIASPYQAMIAISSCTAPIEIRDVELDGNLERLRIGGLFGDTGRQIPASGLWLFDNRAEESVINLFAHHQGQDGVMINGDDKRAARSRLSRLVCHYNGRQGVSLVGGRNYDFADCDFSFTGQSKIYSAPGAGVDIEAEGSKTNRDLRFARCKFRANKGCGMVADVGDSADCRFDECLFVGTETWSAWPKRPGFRFAGCTFAGAIVHAFPDRDPRRAAQFVNCRFTDDPALSPTGRLYEGGQDGGPIVNLPQSGNVLFNQCRFELIRRAVLPWSWNATYVDCTMSQRSMATAYTKGRYLGRTTIKAPVDLYGSMIEGTVILNGKVVPRGPVGVAAW